MDDGGSATGAAGRPAPERAATTTVAGLIEELWSNARKDVRIGVLAKKDHSGPTTLAWKTMVRRIFAEFEGYQLEAAYSPDDDEVRRFRAAFESSTDRLSRATRLVAAFRSEKKKRGITTDDARIFVAAWRLARLPDGLGALQGAVLEQAVADEMTLLYPVSSTSFEALRAYFDEDAKRARIDERLDGLRLRETAQPASEKKVRAFERKLLDFMDLCRTTDKGAPARFSDPDAAEGRWMRAGDLDESRTSIISRDLRRLGLSRLTEQMIPPARSASRRDDPDRVLDWTVYKRVWSVLKGYGRRAPTELPSVHDLVEAEIDAIGSPLGLSVRDNRIALVLGVLMGFSSNDEPGTDAEDDAAGRPRPTGATAMMNGRLQNVHAGLRRKAAGGRATEEVPGRIHLSTTAALERLANPLPWYLPRLWTRLHGLEAISTEPLGAAGAWRISGGVVETFLRDAKSKAQKDAGTGPVLEADDDEAPPVGRRDPDQVQRPIDILRVYLAATGRTNDFYALLGSLMVESLPAVVARLQQTWETWNRELLAADDKLTVDDTVSFEELTEFIRTHATDQDG